MKNYLINNILKEKFTYYFDNNSFGSKESISGEGSTLKQTKNLREELKKLLEKLKIKKFIDAPCGDFNWMYYLDYKFTSYIGIDIVKKLIENNKRKYEHKNQIFLCLDITYESIPTADMIFCRDVLVHLNYETSWQVIENFKRTKSKYLLLTTFDNRVQNNDLSKEEIWRTLNMEIAPFNFPKPLCYIDEKCTEVHDQFSDKKLGLWLLSDILIP